MKPGARIWGTWVAPLALGALIGTGVNAARPMLGDRGAADHVEPDGTVASGRAGVDAASVAPDTTEEPDEDLTEVLADIVELEQQAERWRKRANPKPDCAEDDSCNAWYAPDQAMLDGWARCAQLPVAVPGALFHSSEHKQWFSEAALAGVEATDTEREQLERALTELSSNVHARFSNLHEQIIGAPGTDERPTYALLADLRAMQGIVDEDGEDRRLVARERAGQVEADSQKGGTLVPFYRELVGLGDEVERVIASVLGKPRARSLRAHGSGWGTRISNQPRCVEK